MEETCAHRCDVSERHSRAEERWGEEGAAGKAGVKSRCAEKSLATQPGVPTLRQGWRLIDIIGTLFFINVIIDLMHHDKDYSMVYIGYFTSMNQKTPKLFKSEERRCMVN